MVVQEFHHQLQEVRLVAQAVAVVLDRINKAQAQTAVVQTQQEQPTQVAVVQTVTTLTAVLLVVLVLLSCVIQAVTQLLSAQD